MPSQTQSTAAPNYQTLNEIFFSVVDAGAPDLMRAQGKDGSWYTLSSEEVYARVRAVASGLERLGLKKGDRVALISENRWEWAVTDFACLALGLVDVPLFPTQQGPQIAELLRHSGARVAVVSTAAQLKKLRGVFAETPLAHIFVMDEDAAGEDAMPFSSLWEDAQPGRDVGFDARARAIIIY